MDSKISMDYYSDEIFSAPAGEIAAKAAEDGMTWALLSYLQQWCLSNSFSEKGVCVLAAAYRALGCNMNSWFLSQKYLLGEGAVAARNPDTGAALGLDIGAMIYQIAAAFESPSADSMWVERELIQKELRKDPRSLSAWLHLSAKHVELEELLESVWTLFVVKFNAPASAITGDALREQLELIRIYRTSTFFWAFVAEDTFLSKVGEILSLDKTREEMADSIRDVFANSFGLSLNRNSILRPFVWPK